MDDKLQEELNRNIAIALQEDRVDADVTSHSCFPDSSTAEADLLLKEAATVAGLIFLPLIARAVDPAIVIHFHADEGATLSKPQVIATIEGPVRSLLALERTAINFVQHATSIATQTKQFADLAGETEILDTRKTLPGMRHLQKYAVKVGGGKNHRFDLEDSILIKDNHLKHLATLVSDATCESIRRARKAYPDKRIQIEVANLAAFHEAIREKPDAILLDNMSPSDVKEAVKQCPEGIYLEASGGIHLNTIRSYAETGVHGVSLGKLTHTIFAIDMSMKIN